MPKRQNLVVVSTAARAMNLARSSRHPIIWLLLHRSAAGILTLEKGTFTYRWWYTLEAGQQSPLIEVLPSQPFKTALLHFVPRDAYLVAGLSNDHGDKRWSRATC